MDTGRRVTETLGETVSDRAGSLDPAAGAWELRDRIFSEEHMYTFVRGAAAAGHMEQTLRVLPLMRQYHSGQFRKGRGHVPYIIHPLMIACHCLALGLADDEILPVILLHDVCEDCGVEAEQLPVSDTVREAVTLLTRVWEPGGREQSNKRYYGAISRNRLATIVKVLDRCNNISTMAMGFTRQRMREYILETEQYVLPLLDIMKYSYPECNNAAFLLKYHMLSILESLKNILSNQGNGREWT